MNKKWTAEVRLAWNFYR